MDNTSTQIAQDMFARLRSKANEIHVLYVKAAGADPAKRKELLTQYHRLQMEWDSVYRELKAANRQAMRDVWDRLKEDGKAAT